MRKMDQRGFTIMELVVAMAFVGVVIVSLTDLFASLRQINRAANNYTIATQIGQQLVEQYRNTPYSGITVSATPVDESSMLTPFPSLLTPRSASVLVSQPGASAIKQIDVTISYKDRTGTRTLQFETQVANPGLNR